MITTICPKKTTQNALSSGFKCRKDGTFRVFFLGHSSPQTCGDGQPLHWDGEVAIFGYFFLMSLPLLLMLESACLGERGAPERTDGQTDRQLPMLLSLNEVSLFSLSFTCFLSPKEMPRIKYHST